jgi:hypothetical protein
MEINDMMQSDIASLRQALGISILRKSVNQDAQSVAALLEGMPAVNVNAMESSVTPYKGASIDVRV